VRYTFAEHRLRGVPPEPAAFARRGGDARGGQGMALWQEFRGRFGGGGGVREPARGGGLGVTRGGSAGCLHEPCQRVVRLAYGLQRAGMDADPAERRSRMVEQQIVRRGIRDAAVTHAMRKVPRERFVPDAMAEFAYEDSPLPIADRQTISQPYIVARMTEALELEADDRVLEIGTGSGYAAAVLAELAAEVFTIERHAGLADTARRRLEALGYRNVHVRCGDGTLGWADEAPFDAIAVTAGGPRVPEALREQLAIGGRLVIPVGAVERVQHLVLVRREAEERYTETDLGAVQFVPLIGAGGWPERLQARPSRSSDAYALGRLIHESAERLEDIESVALDPLLERIGDARVVLLGEATHGTAEFYRMRARITRELILRRGFRIPLGTAASRLSRARDRFQRWLRENYLGDEP
jgi:protein-L-isoaspartate(D-aspartate) O-methyltransferase